MFKHILIPTDGSGVAVKAVRNGISLAAEIGARVTGFCAEEVPALHLGVNGYKVEKDIVAEIDRRVHEAAEHHVAEVASAAKAAGVKCDTLVVKSDRPYEAIINAARERGCDAIFMASHGHKGLRGIVLGSVTNQVLTHSTIPVLVFR